MKVAAALFASLIGSVAAAPAIVWKNGKQPSESTVHSSKTVKASKLLAEIGTDSSEESSLAAVFLLGRSEDGTESLSTLASSGSLPLVSSKYNDASVVHSHVAGIESPYAIARDATAHTGRRVLQISLSEFSSKMTSLGQKSEKTEMEVQGDGLVDDAAKDRERALAEANFVIVNVPASTDPSQIDAAVVRAVDHKSVGSVVLAGVRSTDEVKLERTLETRRRMKIMENANNRMSTGRRLEDQQNENGDDDNQNNNNGGNNDDMTGVYYVHMTPNIFAGILFIIFFTVVSWIGISCMGMIAGQDVYVNKMPSIGREA